MRTDGYGTDEEFRAYMRREYIKIGLAIALLVAIIVAGVMLP